MAWHKWFMICKGGHYSAFYKTGSIVASMGFDSIVANFNSQVGLFKLL